MIGGDLAHYCDKCGQAVDPPDAELEFNGLRLSLRNREIEWSGAKVVVRPAPAEILALLMRRRQVSTDALGMMVLRNEEGDHLGIVKVYVCKLRKLLAAIDAPVEIVTIPRFGYRLERR